MHSISAQWRVPATTFTSAPGEAATWIGASGAHGAGFIQLGVIEFQGPRHFSTYYAFWSDVAVHYRSQNLGPVQPGDEVYMSMVRHGSSWVLLARDPASFLRLSTEVRMGGADDYNQGSWVQEDPGLNLVAPRDVSYPDISNVTFRRVRVNAKVPRFTTSDGGELLATRGITRTPTKLVHDSFTFTAPKGTTLRFLNDERGLDGAWARYQSDLDTWTSASMQVRRRDMEVVANMSEVSLHEFSDQPWPKRDRKSISHLERDVQHLITYFRTWAAPSQKGLRARYESVDANWTRVTSAQNKVRSLFTVPPT